tara:strand:- start:72 stop:566 length:495 start_codon:yes stop_codon:yes gene_type:complete
MATITPTLKIVSSSSDGTSSTGPSAFALNLTQTDSLSVVEHAINEFEVDTGANTTLIDGSELETAFVPGTNGCFIYIKNTSPLQTGSPLADNTEVICVGIGADGLAPAVDNGTTDLTRSHTDSARTFSLKAGEFAFFPFDFCGDIVAQATANDQTCEIIRFNRT